MSRITWGSPGSHKFEAGVDRGVFYPQQGPGVPWNGLISIKEDPSGSTRPTTYVDGDAVRSQKTKEDFAVILQAYTCPREFEEYELVNGLRTRRGGNAFGLSYRTLIGNDISGLSHGQQIHIVYNALAMPSKVDFSTLSAERLDATPFSWAISTKPVPIHDGLKPAAHLIIDTTIAYPEAIAAIEDILYGTPTSNPRLPDPTELISIFEQHAILTIIDHGDGTWTAIGPDDVVKMVGPDTFQIEWPSVVYLDEDTYQVSSL